MDTTTTKYEDGKSEFVLPNIEDVNTGATEKELTTATLKQTAEFVPPEKEELIPIEVEKGLMAAKLKQAAPYNIFYAAITSSEPTHTEPLSITMQEILDESLGQIEATVQINFVVDIDWLLGHYHYAGILDKPLLLLYPGDDERVDAMSETMQQLTAVKVKMPSDYGIPHSKIMLIAYADGSMRVVISTANLWQTEWKNCTQGLWISPLLTALPDNADTAAGESITGFKEDFMLHLVGHKVEELHPWLERIRRSDFSAVKVFFIGSVPGFHREIPGRGYPWGHARLGSVLAKHLPPIPNSSRIPIICQSSSVGSFGDNVHGWVQNNFINSFRKDSLRLDQRQRPTFKMIFPTVDNVFNSYNGYIEASEFLSYSKEVQDKQLWLKAYLHQWKSDIRYSTKAMAHLKSYVRLNLEEQSIYWFMLTSANFSKSAWGNFCDKTARIPPCLRVSNYEAGVLFLPRYITGEDTFPMGNSRNGVPAFPLPYDLPLTPYGPDDIPYALEHVLDVSSNDSDNNISD